MAPRILVLNGATRAGGNTDALVDNLIEGMKSVGLDSQLVTLRDVKINNCVGCCQCLRESTCQFDDDMTQLRSFFVGADLVVFASPIYWCEVTGLLKTFIDRLYFFHHEVNRSLVSGKKALTLTTLGEDDAAYESEVLVEFYRRFLKSLGLTILDMLFFPGLMEKEAIEQRPEYLEQAHKAGRQLLTALE